MKLNKEIKKLSTEEKIGRQMIALDMVLEIDKKYSEVGTGKLPKKQQQEKNDLLNYFWEIEKTMI